jgi:hypothetical protein
MKSVIAALLLWIGANTSYDVDLQHPVIKILPQHQLEQVYSKGKGVPKGSTLHAFYDIKENIIYLPDSFDLYDPWHKAVLLHELIHYVQDQNQADFECNAQMETESWPLQKKYLLEMHGVEWEYDLLWHHIVSNCPAPY